MLITELIAAGTAVFVDPKLANMPAPFSFAARVVCVLTADCNEGDITAEVRTGVKLVSSFAGSIPAEAILMVLPEVPPSLQL